MDVTRAPATEADEVLARSAVYRLLSQGFSYPTAEAIALLRHEDVPFALATMGRSEGLREAVAQVEAELEATDDVVLETQYRDAFSHVHSADCPLHETDYAAREIWRMSQELADVAGFYRAFGMEHPRERADHVAVELEFLHLVTYKAAWALAQGDTDNAAICLNAGDRFLTDHVLKWVPGFAARVGALAPDTFLRALAELTLVLLRGEATRLGVTPDEEVAPSPQDGIDDVQDEGPCEAEP